MFIDKHSFPYCSGYLFWKVSKKCFWMHKNQQLHQKKLINWNVVSSIFLRYINALPFTKKLFQKILEKQKLIFFFGIFNSFDVSLNQQCAQQMCTTQGRPSTGHQHSTSIAAHVTLITVRTMGDWSSFPSGL